MRFRERTGYIAVWCALTKHAPPWWKPLVDEVQQLDSTFLTENEQRCALTGRIVRGWDVTHVDHETGALTVTR